MNDVVSKVAGSSITMSLVSAMFFSLFIAMIFEFIRSRNIKEAFAGLQTFFDGMGRAFYLGSKRWLWRQLFGSIGDTI